MSDIMIQTVFITDKGDESVGIFPSFWTIEGETYFDCESDLEDYRIALADAWEFICPNKIEIKFDFEFKGD